MTHPNLTERWVGRSSAPLGALDIRHLETPLFNGNRALICNGAEYLLIFAPGAKKPITTRTGVALAVQIAWRTSPVLLESVSRIIRIFRPRAPYRHMSLFACSVFTLLAPNESHELVFSSRHFYLVTLRPAFTICSLWLGI